MNSKASEDLVVSFHPNQTVAAGDFDWPTVMGRNYEELDGGSSKYFRHFPGQFDDVRVYEGALTADQVATLHASY